MEQALRQRQNICLRQLNLRTMWVPIQWCSTPRMVELLYSMGSLTTILLRSVRLLWITLVRTRAFSLNQMVMSELRPSSLMYYQNCSLVSASERRGPAFSRQGKRCSLHFWRMRSLRGRRVRSGSTSSTVRSVIAQKNFGLREGSLRKSCFCSSRLSGRMSDNLEPAFSLRLHLYSSSSSEYLSPSSPPTNPSPSSSVCQLSHLIFIKRTRIHATPRIQMNKVSGAFTSIDLYRSSFGLLSAQEQSASSCGGAVTILTVLLSVLFFYSPTVNFFSLNNYSTSTSISYGYNPTFNISRSQFMMAVQGYNASDTSKGVPFRVIFSTDSKKLDPRSKASLGSSSKTFEGIPCNVTEWLQYYGDGFIKQFSTLYPQTMFCAPLGFQMNLSGSRSSNSSQISVTLSRYTGVNAMTNTVFNSLFSGPTQVTLYRPLYNFDFNKQNSTSVFLDRSITFSADFNNRVVNMNMFIGKVVVDETQANPWPSSLSFLKNQGQIKTYPKITSVAIEPMGLPPNTYAQMTFYADAQTITYGRSIDKLDTYLSYMGGVFQFINMLAVIILGSYSTLLTSLKLGKQIDFDQASKPNNLHQNFNYFTYLKYQLLGCCDCGGEEIARIKKVEDYVKRITSIDLLELRIRTLQRIAKTQLRKEEFDLVRSRKFIPLAQLADDGKFYEQHILDYVEDLIQEHKDTTEMGNSLFALAGNRVYEGGPADQRPFVQ